MTTNPDTQFTDLASLIRQTNNIEFVQAIHVGTDPTICNPENGETLLHYAGCVAEAAINSNFNDKSPEENWKELHEICIDLIEYGVDPLAKNDMDLTAFQIVEKVMEEARKLEVDGCKTTLNELFDFLDDVTDDDTQYGVNGIIDNYLLDNLVSRWFVPALMRELWEGPFDASICDLSTIDFQDKLNLGGYLADTDDVMFAEAVVKLNRKSRKWCDAVAARAREEFKDNATDLGVFEDDLKNVKRGAELLWEKRNEF